MRSLFMISYDLSAPTSNRQNVEESIKSIGTWCKYLTTTFLVSTYKTIDEVQRIATMHLDSNDKMIISKVQKPIRGKLSNEQWNWIHINL